jgi:hypothetical protein
MTSFISSGNAVPDIVPAPPDGVLVNAIPPPADVLSAATTVASVGLISARDRDLAKLKSMGNSTASMRSRGPNTLKRLDTVEYLSPEEAQRNEKTSALFRAGYMKGLVDGSKDVDPLRSQLFKQQVAIDLLTHGMPFKDQLWFMGLFVAAFSVFIVGPFADAIAGAMDMVNFFAVQHLCIVILGFYFVSNTILGLYRGNRFDWVSIFPLLLGAYAMWCIPTSVGGIRRQREAVDVSFDLTHELGKYNMTQLSFLATMGELVTLLPMHDEEDIAKHMYNTQCNVRLCEPDFLNATSDMCEFIRDKTQGFVPTYIELPSDFCPVQSSRDAHCAQCAKWKAVMDANRGDLTRVIPKILKEYHAMTKALFVIGSRHIPETQQVEFASVNMTRSDFYAEHNGTKQLRTSSVEFIHFFTAWYTEVIKNVREEVGVAESGSAWNMGKNSAIKFFGMGSYMGGVKGAEQIAAISSWIREGLLLIPDVTYDTSKYDSPTIIKSMQIVLATRYEPDETWRQHMRNVSSKTMPYDSRTMLDYVKKECPVCAPTPIPNASNSTPEEVPDVRLNLVFRLNDLNTSAPLLYKNVEPVVAATFADPGNGTVEEAVVLIVTPNLPLPASIPPPPKSNWWYNAVSIPLSLGGIAYLVYALCRDHERSLSNDYWGKKVNMHVLTPSHNMKGKETMPWRYTYYPAEPAWWRSWTFW